MFLGRRGRLPAILLYTGNFWVFFTRFPVYGVIDVRSVRKLALYQGAISSSVKSGKAFPGSVSPR